MELASGELRNTAKTVDSLCSGCIEYEQIQVTSTVSSLRSCTQASLSSFVLCLIGKYLSQ